MIRMCEWCDYKEYEWLLHKSLYWSVYLADVQDYVGRCILVLNRHCGSLSELDISEWIELKTIIDKLEYIYKDILGAELSNWSCLLNNFYKEATPNRQLAQAILDQYQPKSVEDMQDALKDIFGPMFEAMLQGEMNSHLGYSNNERGEKETVNRRNGYTKKTLKTTVGDVPIEVPRDREGTF